MKDEGGRSVLSLKRLRSFADITMERKRWSAGCLFVLILLLLAIGGFLIYLWITGYSLFELGI